MRVVELCSTSPAMTEAIGEAIGRHARAGDLVTLAGELGSGKTVLTRGIARGLDVAEALVSSPTFVLVREYPGRLPCYHLDCYRLSGTALEADQLALPEYVESDGLTVIEWADRLAGALPAARLHLELAHRTATTRTLRITPLGRRAQALLAACRPVWEATCHATDDTVHPRH